MRRLAVLLPVIVLLLAHAGLAGEDDARRALLKAIRERGPAALEDVPHSRLRPLDYAALSRFAGSREKFKPLPAIPAPAMPTELSADSIEAAARRADSSVVYALAAALRSSEALLRVECAARISELGDPRGLAPLKDLLERTGDSAAKPEIEKAWERLTLRYPRARGLRAADLWLDLARATFAGELPREPAGVVWSFDRTLRAEVVEPWLYGLILARWAAECALAREPELMLAKSLLLRIRVCRALTEEALVRTGDGPFWVTAPTGGAGPETTVLEVALQEAEESEEYEILAWLLRYSRNPDRLARALGSEDDIVREAALATVRGLQTTGSFDGFTLTDQAMSGLLAGVHGSNADMAESALAMLSAAKLSAAQERTLVSARVILPDLVDPEPDRTREPTLVTVFYGTDRAEVRPDFGDYLLRFVPAALVLLLSLTLTRTLRGLFHPRFTGAGKWIRWIGVGIAAVLAIFAGYGVARTEFRLDRIDFDYGGERGPFDDPEGPTCHLGTCVVGIPPDHELGEVERPGLLTGEPWENPEKHVLLLKIEPKSEGEFHTELADRGKERAFVFVHGYATTFEHAALRTAQIAHDLDFDGAPIFFSWPSRGDMLSYTIDESTVAWATRHLKEFLIDVRRTLPDSTIHLVAHSMGNRALTEALRRLAVEIENESLPRFQEVVLAAPDVDAATFREDIAPAIRGTAERITLYASASDQALMASKQVHGYPRAGDAEGGVLTVEGIQTVDVATPGRDILGHSYIGNEGRVLDDLVALLLYRQHPERRGLMRMGEGLRCFWMLK
jgi:esterase/lipase superfamily enzyme